jgi:hypothetical protein
LRKGITTPLREGTLSFTFLFSMIWERERKRGGMKEEGALSLVQSVYLEDRKPKRASGPT